ncbi:MAG: hypothetical protein KME60_07725 [Cyanomargarita calcarea GSE-NOS-MK-12-04C]|jgi:hypothetical protein|uniref:Uncharacterized protein n=1 Tax=Cyanomargarita calcarea GSE-NOS-MK-12-04C TaxID=2839659 RepID=A0A951US26_9CYAN|nr:hypothetical protein [Cyanomargarita calcarea GSE-NOS-MK-12-04C]
MKLNSKIARKILSAGVFVAIAFVPHYQIYSQIQKRQNIPSTVGQTQTKQAVTAVESVEMTVSDIDKAVEFYSQVLPFKKVSDVEVLGTEYEKL